MESSEKPRCTWCGQSFLPTRRWDFIPSAGQESGKKLVEQRVRVLYLWVWLTYQTWIDIDILCRWMMAGLFLDDCFGFPGVPSPFRLPVLIVLVDFFRCCIRSSFWNPAECYMCIPFAICSRAIGWAFSFLLLPFAKSPDVQPDFLTSNGEFLLFCEILALDGVLFCHFWLAKAFNYFQTCGRISKRIQVLAWRIEVLLDNRVIKPQDEMSSTRQPMIWRAPVDHIKQY